MFVHVSTSKWKIKKTFVFCFHKRKKYVMAILNNLRRNNKMQKYMNTKMFSEGKEVIFLDCLLFCLFVLMGIRKELHVILPLYLVFFLSHFLSGHFSPLRSVFFPLL